MRQIKVWVLLLFTRTACAPPNAAATETPLILTQPPTMTVAPSLIPAPTETPTAALVTLITQTLQEAGQSPTFTLTANIPQMVGAEAFNALAAELVNDEIALFKEGVLTLPPIPDGYGSYLDIDYDVTYADGAAHPYHYARAIHYNLLADHAWTLAELFTSGSDHLGRIAEHCLAELQTREFVDSLAGAAPIEVNYVVWTITPEGLRITFNEYQVAAYAAGAQTVSVPYEVVRDLIALDGPLANFIQ